MNTESIECRKVEEIEKIGDFTFDDTFKCIYVWLPGTPGPTAIPITLGPDRGEFRIWGWDGNQDKPTLTPSIHWVDFWHGFMRNGKLISC